MWPFQMLSLKRSCYAAENGYNGCSKHKLTEFHTLIKKATESKNKIFGFITTPDLNRLTQV